MSAPNEPRTTSRQDRRRAATRARILTAAEQLFGERGYAQTSIEDIAESADVGVRTIYTHFPSKAAIMLAAFDGWVDRFVAAILARPVDEPVVDTVAAALAALDAEGWGDHAEDADTPVHPMVEHLYSGSADIAGHVLQRWMQEIDRLTRDAAERGDHPAGSLAPRARAVSIFAAWIGSLSAAGSRERGFTLPAGASGHSLGVEILSLIGGGAPTRQG